MTDMNETQWWKKYVPGYEEDTSNIVFSTDNKGSGNTLDNKLKNALSGTELLEYWNELNEYRLKKQKQPKQKLSDVWTHIDFDPNTYKYQYKPNLSKLEKIASNADSAILEEIIDVVATVPSEVPYGNNDRDLHWRLYSIKRAIAENPNVSDCSIEKLKTFPDSFEDAIMCHKDCTEKDLIELANKNAALEWKLNDDLAKPQRKPYKVGELTKWGKIFMAPQASDALKQAIVEHSEKNKHRDWFDIKSRGRYSATKVPSVIDYYLEREDCPKEFFLPAIDNSMDYFYHDYTRERDYYVDGDKLAKIVSHPNMTKEAFQAALDIVAKRMCRPKDEVDSDDLPYHYQGRNDTCTFISVGEEIILENILENPACTVETMVEVFRAAEETHLLENIQEFKKTSIEDKWDIAELLYEREKVGIEEFEKREQMTKVAVLSGGKEYTTKQIKEEFEEAFSRIEQKKKQIKVLQNQTTEQEIAAYEKSRENRAPTTLDKVVEAKLKKQISEKKQNQ